MTESSFNGFSPDTYMFLMELAFNNDKAFFSANKERYNTYVKAPLTLMAQELAPVMIEIDPDFNFRLTSVISRIYRDTRFSKNKLPYRDHAWLCYKYPGERVSESFAMYFEIETKGYGYGMGMYNGNPEFMARLRTHALADPARFIALADELKLKRYVLEGEMYKRDRFPNAPEELKPYINRKGLSWSYYDTQLKRTMQPELLDEVKQAMRELAPMYRFVMAK
ncbi:MAG: DUF2461 domain-containing protein [Clostridia bacterium]